MSRIASPARESCRDETADVAPAPPVESAQGRACSDIAARNQGFYDALWAASSVTLPQRFNTWPLLSVLAAAAPARLEIGPGLRPRLPIAGTTFVDISQPALSRLKAHGGLTMLGDVTALPFPDRSFDLLCAFDIVEHIEDDRQAFCELSRVAKDDAIVVLSVPLHPACWSAFDTHVGHVRRYEPDELLAILRTHSFSLERSAVFGMQPKSGWLLDFAVWGLTHKPVQAMRWYNGLFLPLGLLLQRPLAWSTGLTDVSNVDEILLVCRRDRRSAELSTVVEHMQTAVEVPDMIVEPQ